MRTIQHETYTVTRRATTLATQSGQMSVKRMHVTIPVPSNSGAYQIAAVLNQASAKSDKLAPTHEVVFYVDHGGFYRIGNITQVQHLKAGPVTINVTAVKMTRTHTDIQFTATTSSADLQVFENTPGPGGNLQVVSMAPQQTTIMAEKVPKWDVYTGPIESQAQSLTLKFKSDAGINNQWPTSTDSVTIQLGALVLRSPLRKKQFT